MEMNQEMTNVEKNIRDYTQILIDRAEQRGAIFSDEEKLQLMDYAQMTGDQSAIRRLVRKLTRAALQMDRKEREDILYGAQDEIENLPDPSIGMARLQGYGYTAGDMYPLRRAAALRLHRIGEKIYCLQSDGSSGTYASREMIMAHKGIYGISKNARQRMLNQEEPEEYPTSFSPMVGIGKEEALYLFDAGEEVYLIRTRIPTAVCERMEIERGADVFQIEKEVLEKAWYLEGQMGGFPQIGSLREAKFMLESESRFAIYQIDMDSKGQEYMFMDMDFINQHKMKVEKTDYRMVYSGNWNPEDTLEGLFRRFNIEHPLDFKGHSMSVSDVIVLRLDGDIRSYFVDSFGFREIPDFIDLKQLHSTERAYQVEENEKGYHYFEIHQCDGGYDYTFYDSEYKVVDGGAYDNWKNSIDEVICDIVADEQVRLGKMVEDHDKFIECIDEAGNFMMNSEEPDRKEHDAHQQKKIDKCR